MSLLCACLHDLCIRVSLKGGTEIGQVLGGSLFRFSIQQHSQKKTSYSWAGCLSAQVGGGGWWVGPEHGVTE